MIGKYLPSTECPVKPHKPFEGLADWLLYLVACASNKRIIIIIHGVVPSKQFRRDSYTGSC